MSLAYYEEQDRNAKSAARAAHFNFDDAKIRLEEAEKIATVARQELTSYVRSLINLTKEPSEE